MAHANSSPPHLLSDSDRLLTPVGSSSSSLEVCAESKSESRIRSTRTEFNTYGGDCTRLFSPPQIISSDPSSQSSSPSHRNLSITHPTPFWESSDHADATDRFLLCLTRHPSFASPCRGTCPFLCTTPDTLPRRTRPRNRGTRRISVQSITRKVLWQI